MEINTPDQTGLLQGALRNHHEKGRDLTRSALASTNPERVRVVRAKVRARERAQERRLLHDLTRAVDPDDVETPTSWIAPAAQPGLPPGRVRVLPR